MARKYILLLGVLFFFMPVFVFGQEEGGEEVTDSSFTISGSGLSIDFGVSGYPDSIFEAGTIYDPGNYKVVYDHTTASTTILSLFLVNYTAVLADPVYLKCDGEEGFLSQFGNIVSIGLPAYYEISVPQYCSVVEIKANDVIMYGFQYLPYDLRKEDHSNKDVVFGLSVIIVMLAIAFVSFFFNKIKKKKPWLRS